MRTFVKLTSRALKPAKARGSSSTSWMFRFASSFTRAMAFCNTSTASGARGSSV